MFVAEYCYTYVPYVGIVKAKDAIGYLDHNGETIGERAEVEAFRLANTLYGVVTASPQVRRFEPMVIAKEQVVRLQHPLLNSREQCRSEAMRVPQVSVRSEQSLHRWITLYLRAGAIVRVVRHGMRWIVRPIWVPLPVTAYAVGRVRAIDVSVVVLEDRDAYTLIPVR